MRILIAYRYFLPDSPAYAPMLGNISAWLAEAGHTVELITGQPAYKPSLKIPKQARRENMNGVDVRRISLFKENGMGLAKAINYGLFVIRTFLIVLFGPRRDVIMAGTMPPVLQAWFLSAAAKIRGSEFVYHMQDIHPEIASFNVGKKARGFNLFQKLDAKSNKRARTNVVIGYDMADVLISRGVSEENVTVIRNFAVRNKRSNQPTERAKNSPVRFVFAGNIGIFQNLESLLAVFARLDPSEVTLVLVGEGRAKKGLIETVKNKNIKNVEFHDHMSESDVFNFLCDQDIGVVSLSPGIYKFAFPSKVWTYIAAELPMFSMVEEESDLAKFLESNNLGQSVGWQASEEMIAEKIMLMVKNIREQSYSVTENKHMFESSIAKKRWVALFEEIASKRI